MGSRIVVPLVAALLAVGGFAVWTLRSKPSPHVDAVRIGATEEVASLRSSSVPEVPEQVEGDSAGPSRRALSPAAAPAPERQKQVEVADGTPLLVGRVTDKFENPLEGARVRLLTPHSIFSDAPSEHGGIEALTGADGRFEIAATRAGTATISVRASGFSPLEKSQVPIPAGRRHDLGDFVLHAGAILSGQVVDSNGRPVEGAELHLASARAGFFASEVLMSRLREPLSVTGVDGSFRVDELACGHWQILVQSETEPWAVFEGDAEVPGAEVFGLEFRLPPSATIAGRVLGVPPDKVGRVVVRARPLIDDLSRIDDLSSHSRRGVRTAGLENDGTFLLPGLQMDEQYDLQVRDTATGEHAFFGGAARSDSVRARAGDRGVELIFNLGARLAFVVADARSGERITTMEVFAGMDWPLPVRGEDGRVRREFPEGRVEVSELFPRKDKNSVTLRIRATGYADYVREGILLEPGSDLDLGRIELEPVPVVVVTVVDDRSGLPVEGARVNLRRQPLPAAEGVFSIGAEVSIGEDVGDIDIGGGEGSRARTDANGVAVLTSIEGETCQLRVESEGHAPALIDGLVLPRGQRIAQEVRLLRGGSVVVDVVDNEGGPVPGVEVEHRPPGRSQGTVVFGDLHGGRHVTDAEGVVVFEHLEPGLHAFRIAERAGGPAGFFGESSIVMIGGPSDDGEEPWSEVEITEDAQRELTLVAPPRGRLEGRVREGGIPLAGATLRLNRRDESGGAAPGRIQMMGMLGGGGPSTESDGDGHYSFEGVKPGEYALEITHPARVLPAIRELEVEERGGEVFARFDVELTVSVIEGRIADRDGNPLGNVEVWAERVQSGPSATIVSHFVMIGGDDEGESVTMGGGSAGKRVRSAEDGTYRLRGVPADVELIVKADAKFFEAAQSESVHVAPDQVRREVDLSLEGAGQIEVSVTAPDGSARGMCMCIATFQGEGVEPVRDVVGPSGRLVLSGLRAGRWDVGVQAFGFGGGGAVPPDVVRTVDVLVGETSRVTLASP